MSAPSIGSPIFMAIRALNSCRTCDLLELGPRRNIGGPWAPGAWVPSCGSVSTTTCSVAVSTGPQDVVVWRWYRIPDSRGNVSCVSAAFAQYPKVTHETEETESIRVQIRVQTRLTVPSHITARRVPRRHRAIGEPPWRWGLVWAAFHFVSDVEPGTTCAGIVMHRAARQAFARCWCSPTTSPAGACRRQLSGTPWTT